MQTYGPLSAQRIAAWFGVPDPLRDNVLALAFNGSSLTGTLANTNADVDEVSFGTPAAFDGDGAHWSISFWLYPLATTAGTTRYLLAFWDWGTGSGRFAIGQDGVNGTNIKVQFAAAAGTDVLDGSSVTTDGRLVPNAWNHVVVAYNGPGASQAARGLTWINSVLATRTNLSIDATQVATVASQLRLGRWNGSVNGTTGQCLMRDVRYWAATTLTQADVDTLYAGGTPATAATGTWPLNGDLLDTIAANHGTSTPAAPAGPDFVMRTQTWPKIGSYTLLVVGDSNTAGTGFVGAWRREMVAHLWHRYGKKLRIVGRYVDTTTPEPFLSRYPNHSGLSGQQIGANASSGMRGEIETDIANYLPDGILIMGGTNDISTGAQTPAQTLARLQGWLNEAYATADFADADPIWICSILPRTDGDAADNAAFNALLPGEAAARQLAGQNVIHVAAGEEESVRGLQADGVHASDIGHRKMGALNATALNAVVP